MSVTEKLGKVLNKVLKMISVTFSKDHSRCCGKINYRKDSIRLS